MKQPKDIDPTNILIIEECLAGEDERQASEPPETKLTVQQISNARALLDLMRQQSCFIVDITIRCPRGAASLTVNLQHLRISYGLTDALQKSGTKVKLPVNSVLDKARSKLYHERGKVLTEVAQQWGQLYLMPQHRYDQWNVGLARLHAHWRVQREKVLQRYDESRCDFAIRVVKIIQQAGFTQYDQKKEILASYLQQFPRRDEIETDLVIEPIILQIPALSEIIAKDKVIAEQEATIAQERANAQVFGRIEKDDRERQRIEAQARRQAQQIFTQKFQQVVDDATRHLMNLVEDTLARMLDIKGETSAEDKRVLSRQLQEIKSFLASDDQGIFNLVKEVEELNGVIANTENNTVRQETVSKRVDAIYERFNAKFEAHKTTATGHRSRRARQLRMK